MNKKVSLNRLAMHQEWFDENQNMLFIDAKGIMRELLAMCRQYKAERDEARRLYCIAFQEITENLGEKNTTESIAKEMGWDCFKENTND